MNGKMQVDINVLRILYYRYREFILPIIVTFVCWVIFFQFGFPQIQTFLTEKDQISTSEQTLAVMSQNYNTVASFPDMSLQSLLDTANQALPSTKDFVGILTAISNAAGIAGVTVNDYSFNVGDLSSAAPVVAGPGQTITIGLSINGNLDKTKQFIQALSNQLPLSEVTSLTVEANSLTSINARFYYQPIPPLALNAMVPIQMLSATQKQLLGKLSKNTIGVSPVGSQSAIVLPSPSLVQASSSSAQ